MFQQTSSSEKIDLAKKYNCFEKKLTFSKSSSSAVLCVAKWSNKFCLQCDFA